MTIRRLLSTLNTILIEKSAKLDSSIVRLQADLTQPKFIFDHLQGKEVDEAKTEVDELRKVAVDELSKYADAVKKWKDRCLSGLTCWNRIDCPPGCF
jgi:hypothetical protein